MKKKDVPQDKSNLESASFRELCYAVDDTGKYTTQLSSGWNPKTIALDNAIKEIHERATEALKRFDAGVSSPIEYYMEVNKMDLQILSSYMGIWQWRIKRHFKPKVFAKLKDSTLGQYAKVFSITKEQLLHPSQD